MPNRTPVTAIVMTALLAVAGPLSAQSIGYIERMAASNPAEVRQGYLKVPTGPALDFEMTPD